VGLLDIVDFAVSEDKYACVSSHQISVFDVEIPQFNLLNKRKFVHWIIVLKPKNYAPKLHSVSHLLVLYYFTLHLRVFCAEFPQVEGQFFSD
jgi:hypothetical protein